MMVPRHDKLPQTAADAEDHHHHHHDCDDDHHPEEDGRVGVASVTADEVVLHADHHHSSFHYASSARHPPSWWVVRLLSVLLLALIVNIALLMARTGGNRTQQLSSISGSSPLQPPRISEKLNNATIPNWKPLPDASQTITTVAFGSCFSQEMPQPVWDTLQLSSASLQPVDLFLLMGDNVYGDCAGNDCHLLREAYKTWAAHPSLQTGATQVSVFATLDDHDYGLADCHVDNPHKDIARDLFAEFFAINARTELPANDGVYRAAAWGPPGQRLQVILLDTRYSRSPFVETNDAGAPYQPVPDDDRETEQHMLSEAQWSWLEAQLNEPADLRLVVSSVQVLNNVTGFEAWRHLPRERERLVKLLQHKTAILLTGDRHVGAFYESNDLVEVTASSFTHTIPFGAYCNGTTAAQCDEVDPARLGDLVRENHFGTATVDWAAKSVRLALRRTQASYGSTYLSAQVQAQFPHGKFSDAGQVLVEREYDFADL